MFDMKEDAGIDQGKLSLYVIDKRSERPEVLVFLSQQSLCWRLYLNVLYYPCAGKNETAGDHACSDLLDSGARDQLDLPGIIILEGMWGFLCSILQLSLPRVSVVLRKTKNFDFNMQNLQTIW